MSTFLFETIWQYEGGTIRQIFANTFQKEKVLVQGFQVTFASVEVETHALLDDAVAGQGRQCSMHLHKWRTCQLVFSFAIASIGHTTV